MVYVYLANGFEEIEALTPVDCLRRCEIEVKTVGVSGRAVTGSHGISVFCDLIAEEAVIDDRIDMIILPGGMPGTLNLEKSPYVQKAIDFCTEHDKPVAAICAAPSILGHKGLLKGKKAVCYPGFEDQLLGAEVLEIPAVTDGKIITACGMGAALEFSYEIISMLISKERAKTLLKALNKK